MKIVFLATAEFELIDAISYYKCSAKDLVLNLLWNYLSG